MSQQSRKCNLGDTLATLRRCLTAIGILVINVCGNRRMQDVHIERIRQVFGENYLTLPVRPAGNLIALAFKGSCADIRCEDLDVRAPDLQRRWQRVLAAGR